MNTMGEGAMKVGVFSIAAVTAFLVVAGTGAAATTPKITVKMSEFKFVLSKKTVPVGKVSFRVRNVGEYGHNFLINGKTTPVYTAGQGGVLVVTFPKAGRYKFYCTEPDHAAKGMRGVLVVTKKK